MLNLLRLMSDSNSVFTLLLYPTKLRTLDLQTTRGCPS